MDNADKEIQYILNGNNFDSRKGAVLLCDKLEEHGAKVVGKGSGVDEKIPVYKLGTGDFHVDFEKNGLRSRVVIMMDDNRDDMRWLRDELANCPRNMTCHFFGIHCLKYNEMQSKVIGRLLRQPDKLYYYMDFNPTAMKTAFAMFMIWGWNGEALTHYYPSPLSQSEALGDIELCRQCPYRVVESNEEERRIWTADSLVNRYMGFNDMKDVYRIENCGRFIRNTIEGNEWRVIACKSCPYYAEHTINGMNSDKFDDKIENVSKEVKFGNVKDYITLWSDMER